MTDGSPVDSLPGTGAIGELRRGAIAGDLISLGLGDVRFDRHNRMLYATDASMYQVEPIGVVIPRNTGDIERTVRYCAENGLPILPRAGGTSLAGQTVNRAVVIDLSRYCRSLTGLDVRQKEAVVQSGLVLDDLNKAASEYGLMFGPDVATSSHACLGGMIGNNSAGAHSVLFGRTVDHVLGVEVLLADGSRLTLDEGAAGRDQRVRELTGQVAEIILSVRDQVRRRFPRTMRRVNGYNLDLLLDQIEGSTPGTFDKVNLAHLICGAEGTLCIVTEARLRLVDAPKCKGLAIIPFAGVPEALAAVNPILKSRPAAVELVDDVVLDLARRNTEYRRYVDLLPRPGGRDVQAVLYVEYFAESDDELKTRTRELTAQHDEGTVQCYFDATSIKQAWMLRKAGEPLLHGLPGLRKPIAFVEDTAVSPERLPEFVERFRAIVKVHGTKAAYYAHASVGCLHIRPLVCLREEKDRRMMESIASDVADLVMEFGGALSGEHGDGRVRSHLLRRFYGDEICDAFAKIKQVFDPRSLLNPGNIINGPEMMAALRVMPETSTVRVPEVDTFFRYEGEHGFEEAAELCNGAGVCRRTDIGAMCPSYRATRDERDSTRGRGNAIRLAVTGQLEANGQAPLWNDPETAKTLDLCLSCKACKSECPSNVDVAKLKAEYTAQSYRQAGGAPLRKQIIGHVRTVNRIASAIHPIANLLGRITLPRRLMSWAMGFDSRRSLPEFGPSLYGWMKRRRTLENSTAPAVILLPDCFTVFNEPRVGRAAVRALEALGYRVVLPEMGCCGRSFISMGLLDDAIRVCRTSAESLLASVAENEAIAVVACEPSCASAVADDWVDLKLGLDVAGLRNLAGMTMLVEDFVESRWDDHPNPIDASPASDRELLLHGHCHQKALGTTDLAAALMRRIFGDGVVVLDSGCCGMAGAFGYQKGHYDISMEIGELSLFGPIRGRPDAAVAAPGTSCRQQIHDGTGRAASHPIELFAEAIL